MTRCFYSHMLDSTSLNASIFLDRDFLCPRIKRGSMKLKQFDVVKIFQE